MIAALATRYDCEYKDVRPYISSQIEEWGVAKITDGDTLTTSELGARRQATDSRDATYVRVRPLFNYH
jgi:hypothetical protein